MDIFEYIDTQINEFNVELDSVIDDILFETEDYLSRFVIEEGSIIPHKNYSKLTNFKSFFTKTVTAAGFYTVGESVINGHKQLYNEVKKITAKTLGKKIPDININIVQSLQKLDYSKYGNLADELINAIDTVVKQDVQNGQLYKTMIDNIRKQLGKFQFRAETYVRTVKKDFTQTIQNELARKIKFGKDDNDLWEYFGAPLQSNSHDECVWALRTRPNPYFTQAEKDEFLRGGGYPHSEPRWNCQHIFVMTDKKRGE